MINIKRIISTALSLPLCFGMIIPTVASSNAAAANPFGGIDSSSYTRIDFGSGSNWTWTLVNKIEPSHEYTTYRDQKCVKLGYNDLKVLGTDWRYLDPTGKHVNYCLSGMLNAKDRIPTDHRYAVVTYATDSQSSSDLIIHHYDPENHRTVLTDDISESEGYWVATAPAEVADYFFTRMNFPAALALFTNDTDPGISLYIKELVLFKNKADAKKYADAVPYAYNADYANKPETQYIETEVSYRDFEKETDVSELGLTTAVANNVYQADDEKGTNKRDPQRREVSGIPTIETEENGNRYLRVSKRLGNVHSITIPIASASALEKAGKGKYVLTFDMKAITTEKMYQNFPGSLENNYFYVVDFLKDQIGYRMLLAGASGAQVIGTAPGDLIGFTVPTDGHVVGVHLMPSLDEWHKLYFEFDIENTSTALNIGIFGGNWPIRNADFGIDNIKLTRITKQTADLPAAVPEIPAGPATDIAAEGYTVQGIMLNLDDSRFAYPNRASAAFLTEEDAVKYIDQFVGCHITDLALCVNATFVSMYPSEVWDDGLDAYEKTKNTVAAVWNRYETLGIDPWQLWIDRLWENKVNPWLSFRLNDHHGHLTDDRYLMGDWFRENYALYKRVDYRDDLIYRGDRCPDFNHPVIREKWLAYIEEAVNRYDVYGIELDWLRDPIFTTMGNEMASMDMLTGFHRDIKAIVDKAELKWGHEIKIAVRCARDIQTNVEAGLDIITWCAEDIVDVVIPSAYYMTDTEIPVQTWKKILQAYDVELYPNVTQGYISTRSGDVSTNDVPYVGSQYHTAVATPADIIAGTAASYFAQGADKMYVYNVFGDSADPITAEHKIDTDIVDAPDTNNYARWRMQTTIGSIEKLQTVTRRYFLAYQDYAGYFGTPHTQLPAEVKKADKYDILHFYTGDVEEDDTVTLRLAAENSEMDYSDAMKIFVNGKPATLISRTNGTDRMSFGYYVYTFAVDKSVINNSVMVELTTTDDSKPYSIIYAELVFSKTNG